MKLIGYVLVLGGALGNLTDRFFRSPGFLRGHVVDFVAVGRFPVFNVADSCITIGAILLVVAHAAHLIGVEPSPRDFRERRRADRGPAGRSTASASTGRVALLTGWSRDDVQTLLEAGAIVVDGRAVGKSHQLRVGRAVDVLAEPAPSAPPQPEPDVTIDVRYEDDGRRRRREAGRVSSCIPVPGTRPARSCNGLLARVSRDRGRRRPVPARASCTASTATRAGCWSSRRSDRAYDALVEQLSARAVERRYLALGVGISRDAARA